MTNHNFTTRATSTRPTIPFQQFNFHLPILRLHCTKTHRRPSMRLRACGLLGVAAVIPAVFASGNREIVAANAANVSGLQQHLLSQRSSSGHL